MGVRFDRLRNPAHTGDRRCWPCTAVNAAVLLAAAGAVARRRSRAMAAALGLAGSAAIGLRGYLVPYTPRFAPGLVAALPGEFFRADDSRGPARGDAPDASGSLGGDADEQAGEQVLAALLDAGVVEHDDGAVYLDDGFREAWRAEMRELRRRNDDGLAGALGSVAPEGTVVDAVESGGDAWFVVSDGSDDPAAENWLTRPVAVAETAAVWVLADRTDLSAAERVRATGPLRTLLEACPVCDGAVEETTVVECCGGPGGTRADAPDEVLACRDCGARLYTFQ